jgi:hypothetical protein
MNDNINNTSKLSVIANVISKIGFPIVVTLILLYANFTTGKEILETLQRIEMKLDYLNNTKSYKQEFKLQKPKVNKFNFKNI